MAKSVRVQFEDGTSHVYEDVPDDVDTSAVEARAAEEFGKTPLTAHSPNQGAAPGAVPGQEPPAPKFGDYSTLPTSTGQLVGAAAIPLQIAAEHPAETAAGLGLYKAGQVANAYIGGKNVEAEAARQVAAQRAQAQAGHQAIQQQKINLKAGVPAAPVPGPVAPPAILGANGMPMAPTAPVAPTAPPVATAPAQAAEQSLASRIREVAASKISGLAQANPMLATAGRVVGKALPLAGTALGAAETYNRADQGDYLGAGLAGIGTAASVIPVVGTGINLATTGINAARDYSKYLEAKKKYEQDQKKKIK